MDFNNREQSYGIKDLSSFGITDKESYLIGRTDLDITPFETNKLVKDRNQMIVKDTLQAFLVLLKADYSLLYLKDATDKEHFFYKDGQKIIELTNHKFLQQRGEKLFEFNNKLYQKQLEMLFNQCGKKIPTNNLTYEIMPLTDKFIEFSECIGCTYTCYVKKKEDKSVFTLGVMVGAATDGNFFSHKDYFDYSYFETKTTVPNMLFGVSASFSPKRNLNRNILGFEVFFNKENVRDKASNFSKSINYLNFVPLYRRQFVNQKAIKPFVGAGIIVKYLISYPDKDIFTGDRLNLYLMGEGGIKWNNLLLSARIKVKPKENKEDTSILYKDVAEIVDVIRYQRVNFQFSLTYLLFNSGRKAR
ncbi:hypothetical protein [Emticicia sp. C21]|uniref:hypothetical protein n=1 Tax=Emticicia sp. C21 TaxID=2302915 RepID=UPI000E34FB62|nr:hypothetical protein [Emticicia sp. C21]RFS15128.1 hypothetical protein D0T08_18810 [Emticicia sp. C21]